MFDEVENYLGRLGAAGIGPGAALYHESQFIHKGREGELADVEAALPVAGPLAESDRVKVKQLPEVEVAFVVHHGSYAGLSHAKQAVFSWLQANGYRRAGAIREVYLHHDPDHQADEDSPRHVTEVQFPVTQA
jgi:effector-binding domain-containing protein